MATGGAAAVAYVGEPGTGAQATSSGPDLLTATITREVDPGDPLGPQARFCYDEVLNAGTIPPGAVGIGNYDSEINPRSTNATIDTNDPKCIIATFANGLEIGQFTVALQTVSQPIEDTAGTDSPQESARLDGTDVSPVSGATTAPDLISTQVDAGASPPQITYTFDENLDPALSGGGAALADDFGFYVDTDNGNSPRLGSGIVGVTRNSIVVSFTVAQTVSQAKRFFYNPDGGDEARDRVPGAQVTGSKTNTASPIAAVGDPITGGPSLVSGAKQTNNQIVDLTFAQAVIPGPPAAFAGNIVAYRADASPIPGTYSIGTSGGNTAVLPLTMPSTTQNDAGSVVRVGLRPGVVRNQANDRDNAFGSAAISTEPARAGYTDGPDLLRTTIDDATNRVSYEFDEELDEDNIDATFFNVINSDATTRAGQAGTAVLSADKRTVSVRFDGSVSGSAVAGVSNLIQTVYDSVDDAPPNGNESPNGSVSTAIIACQPGTCPVTPTPTATTTAQPTPTATQPPGQTITIRTKVTIKRLNRGKRFKGKVKAANPCQSGRTVRLYKGSKRLKTVPAKGNGSYVFNFKKRVKGKVRSKVTKRTVSQGVNTVNCTVARSKKV